MMGTLLILLLLTLAGMVAAGYAFIWAVRSDQFDDLEGPAHQILFDEDIRPLKPENSETLEDNLSTATTQVKHSEEQRESSR